MNDKLALVVDVKQRRPACVLLQAAFGAFDYHRLMSQFDPASWLVFPTDDMRLIEGSIAQWEHFAVECNQRYRPPLFVVERTPKRKTRRQPSTASGAL